MCGTRTPIALATALPTAAQIAIAGGSPNPITPRLSFSGRISMYTLISPISPMPGLLRAERDRCGDAAGQHGRDRDGAGRGPDGRPAQCAGLDRVCLPLPG